MKIRYFDLGTCKCQELIFMKDFLPTFVNDYEIHGFEGVPTIFDKFKQKYSKYLDEKTHMHNLIISDQHNTMKKIYYAPNTVGNSIHQSKKNVQSDKYWTVPSVRFSHWLKDNNIDLKDSFNIVKINIEGAEWEFFNDIVDNNIKNDIDIICGTGHDVIKIKDFVENGIVEKYYKLLEDNNIHLHKWNVGFLWGYESQRVDIVKLIKEKYNKKIS